MNIEFGVYLNGIDLPYDELKARWIAAESAGFDFVWMMDNVVGPVPYLPEEPVMDTWTCSPRWPRRPGASSSARSSRRMVDGVLPSSRSLPQSWTMSAMGVFIWGWARRRRRQHAPWGQHYGTPAERHRTAQGRALHHQELIHGAKDDLRRCLPSGQRCAELPKADPKATSADMDRARIRQTTYAPACGRVRRPASIFTMRMMRTSPNCSLWPSNGQQNLAVTSVRSCSHATLG